MQHPIRLVNETTDILSASTALLGLMGALFALVAQSSLFMELAQH